MAGGLGPAYGQTDVMHDRSYLIANLAHRDRAVRKQAAAALDELNRQEAQQRHDYALQQRDAALAQRQSDSEAYQRRVIAHQNALEMDKQLKMDRDTEIDEQGHGLMLSMMKLEAAKRRGEITKDQFDSGLLDAASQFPMGLRHPEARKHLDFLSTEADKQNAFMARRKVIEDAKSAARLTGPPPEKIAQRYARVQGTLDQYNTAQQSDIARQKKSNMDAKIENAPYNPNLDAESRLVNSNLAGAKTESQFLERSYPQLTGQVQQTQAPINTPTPAPTPPSVAAPTEPSVYNQSTGQWNIPGVQTPAPDPTQAPIYTPSPSPEVTATPPPLADIFADQPQTP